MTKEVVKILNLFSSHSLGKCCGRSLELKIPTLVLKLESRNF
jgi:hypothetical protein